MDYNRSKVIFICFLFMSSLFAQVNIEKDRISADKDGFNVKINSSLSIISGNSELISFNLAPTGIWKMKRYQLFFLNDYERIVSDEHSFVNKGFSHIRHTYIIRPNIKYELFTQAEFNKARLLDRRTLIGSGFRYVLKAPDGLAVGLSYMLENEKISDTEEVYSRGRLSSYLHLLKKKNDLFNFENTIYYQPVWNNFSNFRIIYEGEYKIKISNSFSLLSKLMFRYDSKPYGDLLNYDLEFKQGFEWVLKR